MRKYILLLIFIFEVTLTAAQYKEPAFGEIDTLDLQMTRYENDTAAAALILFDNGKLSYNLNKLNRFQNIFVRHCRIKIFNKSTSHLGEYVIPLLQNEDGKEVLSDLKAATYNLVDGKIIQTNLDSSNIFIEVESDTVNEKLAFPDIKEGSVIEFSYKITSDDIFNLRGWEFQYPYPAIWSQYMYIIPEYFIFRKISKGYLQYDINLFERSSKIYTQHFESQGYNGSNRTYYIDHNIKLNTLEAVLAIADVPAFVPEPNIDCPQNYIKSLQFEIISIRNPDQTIIDYTQSWKSVNKLLNESVLFGKLFKSKRFIYADDTITSIYDCKSTDMQKAVALYNYIQKRMKWNEIYQTWAYRGLENPYKDRMGTSSEINLLLTLILQNAGLKANPVIISTRDHGTVDTSYPTILKFNSVICRLEIDSTIYLLDATNKYSPFGVLPPNDLNGKGRVVDKLNGDWVDLNPKEKFREVKNYVLTLSDDGKFRGTITEIYDGYGAAAYREKLSKQKSSAEYFRKIQENTRGLTINSYSISDLSDNYKPITDTLHVEISDCTELMADKIVFNPMLFERIEKNIYTLEDRKYPVDYNYLFSEMYIFDFTLPNGYEVESLPESTLLKLPDNSINISYNIQQNGNKITLSYKRNINKIVYLPDEYKNLKEMYDQMVRVNSGMVILKKNRS